MAVFSVTGMRMKGIASAVPSATEKNTDLHSMSEQERNMLIKTTGISTRHIAPAGLTTADLCAVAAEKLIAELGWKKEEIGLLVFVSQSPDYFLPASSVVLQDRLGLSKTTAAFDINLGCSGFVYGLSVASSMIATGGFRKALLLAGDISTLGITPADKSTWPLFGDAGTATALEFDEQSVSYFNLQSDGGGKEAIIIPDGGARNPVNDKTFIVEEIEKGISRHRRNLWLNGLDVFNFSVREAPTNISTLMEKANVKNDDIDYFIFHQANLLMDETIRKKLKIAPEKVPYSLRDYGNTSSASIPLTIVSQLKDKVAANRKWILSGFGVGLSWGSCYTETNGMICPDVIEV